MSDRCCADPSCKRRTPILLRRGAIDGRWWVLTRYTRTGGTVRSIERHLLDDDTQAGLDEMSVALDAVARVRELHSGGFERGECSQADAGLRCPHPPGMHRIAVCEYDELDWPCPTIKALDGTDGIGS